jgi:hypothetical protein
VNKIRPTFLNDRNSLKFESLRNAYSQPSYPDCSLDRFTKDFGKREHQGMEVFVRPCITDIFRQVPAFYNNFEVADLRFLRGEKYQHWFNAVDKSGNIYLHRWGDAPIRFLGLSMYLEESKIEHVSPAIVHPFHLNSISED